MATCKACGAEEDLAQPFVDGTCVKCLRRKAPLVPDHLLAERSREGSERWTGGRFLATAGLLFVVSLVAGVISVMLGEIGSGPGVEGPYLGLAPLASLGSCATMSAAAVMVLIGIIRCGVHK